jgi:hypothetical protein
VADDTCSVPGCEALIKNKARQLCRMHYQRWWKTGEVGQAEPLLRPAPPECIIPDCQGIPRVRGLCGMHYWRKKTSGDPGSAEKRRKPSPPECTFDGCDRKAEAHSLCRMHYKREWRHGDPALGATRAGATDVSYYAVHARLHRRYGPATAHPCRMCSAPACDWAYDHGDPNEQRGEDGLVYSLDLTRYMPVCRPCHRKLDADG